MNESLALGVLRVQDEPSLDGIRMGWGYRTTLILKLLPQKTNGSSPGRTPVGQHHVATAKLVGFHQWLEDGRVVGERAPAGCRCGVLPELHQ